MGGTSCGLNFPAAKPSKLGPLTSLTTARRHIGKEIFDRSKPHINIGTIAYCIVRKGLAEGCKNNLLSIAQSGTVLSYEQAHSAPKERPRGIAFNTARIEDQTPRRYYAYVDWLGQTNHNMIICWK